MQKVEALLANEGATGTLDSKGEFGLDQVAALEKLAQFQLPSAGSWALKILQAIVANGGKHPIRVEQTRDSTSFYFTSATGWTNSQLESCLQSPEIEPERALNCLKSGFWAVGIGQRRPVTISLKNESENLNWSGEGFWLTKRACRIGYSVITVSHFANDDDESWLGRMLLASRRNAEVATSLANDGFACPVQLTLGGRRLDSLLFCEAISGLVHTMGLPESELPPLRLSSGTWSLSVREQASVAKSFRVGRRVREAPLTLLFCLSPPHSWLEPRSSPCYWIQDGVVVGRDDFPVPPSKSRLVGFVNADELPVDLTTLQLSDSPEREQRFAQASADIVRFLLESPPKSPSADPRWLLKLLKIGNLGSTSLAVWMYGGGVALGLGAGAVMAMALDRFCSATIHTTQTTDTAVEEMVTNWTKLAESNEPA